MSAAESIVLRGEARLPGGSASAAQVSFGPDGFGVAVADGAPWSAAYRDIGAVVVDAGAVLVQLGSGTAALRWIFERFGASLGALARGLREGRLRQWLGDGLVPVGVGVPIELVEYATGASTGVAQILYHDRGIALAPLDDRVAPVRIARADIGAATVDMATGGLRVAGLDGPLVRGRTSGASATPEGSIAALELLHLGQAAASHRDRWAALRDGAVADTAAILGALLTDAPFEVRSRATAVLREGHPADQAALGAAWSAVEAAVLTEPAFAESYRALVARTADGAAPRWLAVAADRPGAPDRPRVWFLVRLPGNLLALELVSAGAHATYFFRVAPRASYGGGPIDPRLLALAVRDVSDALVDARFLREPMAIPADRLAAPQYLRYQLALAALPALAAARRRFVGRIVHADPATWAAAIDDLVQWHGSQRDEAAEWPGRAAQEAAISGTDAGAPAEED